jgi:hypothetical protein
VYGALTAGGAFVRSESLDGGTVYATFWAAAVPDSKEATIVPLTGSAAWQELGENGPDWGQETPGELVYSPILAKI